MTEVSSNDVRFRSVVEFWLLPATRMPELCDRYALVRYSVVELVADALHEEAEDIGVSPFQASS